MLYEQIASRKLISAYGGIGSIIETRHGAVKICDFDQWAFFNQRKDAENHVQDERFKARLKTYFKDLRALVRLPENSIERTFKPQNLIALAKATYFPKWMHCPKCHTFDDYDNWKQHWENKFANNESWRNNFHPPKCYKCSEIGQRKYELEQVRFIMTSPSGNVVDVPWKHWALRQQTTSSQIEVGLESDGDDTKEKTLDLSRINISDNIHLEYHTSSHLGDLKGIIIRAYTLQNGHKTQIGYTTLEGIFSLRVYEYQHPDLQKGNTLLKTVIRSSNSVYYPNVSNSIFLPTFNKISSEICDKIRKKHERGRNIKTIQEDLADDNVNLTEAVISSIIDNNFQSTVNPAVSEEQYRFEEYDFITKNKTYQSEELRFEQVPKEYADIEGIASLYRIDKLKVTTVQTSYTRQKPIDKDAYLAQPPDGEIKRKYTTSYNERTYYLPAYEGYGEGILIQLDDKKLAKWAEQEEVQKRVGYLQQNFANSFLGQNRQKDITSKFVLIHTLSHLIIKELEFLCGYPATSLQERLYVGEGMQGVLIYTVAGAEGSYGGLVSQCKSDKIGKIILSALHRAEDCASDPICYHTDSQGQGTAGLNLAACHSCALLPETSCEEVNSYLDRFMVVDAQFGFFRNR